MCQCRFRKLLVGLDDAPAAKVNATTGPDMYDRKSVAGRRAVPTRREYWDNIWGEGEADMRTPSPSPGSITTDFGRAHPQYAPPDRRRRESRRVGEAHGPSVVRLDASAITSLHLLRGDDDAKDGSIGSLFNYLDATVSATFFVCSHCLPTRTNFVFFRSPRLGEEGSANGSFSPWATLRRSKNDWTPQKSSSTCSARTARVSVNRWYQPRPGVPTP